MYTYYEHTYKKCILQINSEIKDEHFQVCFFVPLTFRKKLHGQLWCLIPNIEKGLKSLKKVIEFQVIEYEMCKAIPD